MGLLEGKVALITGAARGIGRAIAEVYAEHGAKVAIGDLRLEECRQVVKGINALYPDSAIAVDLDVTVPKTITRVVEETVAAFGELNILVNDAGIHRPHYIIDFPVEDWDLVYSINVRGTFLCTQAAALQMIKQGKGGCIINISSASGKKPDPQGAAYCSSKSAIIGFTRVAALEFGKYRIRANAILPGATNTEMLQGLIRDVPGLIEELVDKTPMGRMAEPRDQANAAVFLASDLASHITGDAIVVSGGEFMDS
ncbi:MAG TPA: SDR family NAD(P)-dependent oxidoreductase [Anaerolineaceae bacterium]|nr:SDR family NAD(P)-dependent oxidoreductase [Anaerolineaceae bacterium]HQP08160.1 SDR family NAD(P)-dependent oxidoreductase [Anaerolineaceae bacterium]